MTGNIPSSSNGKTGKETVIEGVEYDVDEISDSHFSKAAAIIFDIIYDWKYGVLPSSKFVDLIETLGGGFHGKYLVGHLQKVDPN